MCGSGCRNSTASRSGGRRRRCGCPRVARWRKRLVAWTDAEGRFELRAAPLGSVPLRLVPPFADLVFDGPLEFDVAAADRETAVVTLRRRR